jgi:hypothetical protein
MKMLWEKISIFAVKTVVADLAMEYPQEIDWFVMQLFFEMGYPWEILQRLNHVHIFLQVLFLSDILTASGNKIDPKVLLHRPTSKARSRMRLPTECSMDLAFQLWRDAMHILCPSRRPKTQVGHFTAPTHKIWQWTWDNTYGFLCHASNDGGTKDVFVAGWKPTRFHYSYTRPSCNKGTICLVKPTHACGGWQLTSLALATIPPSKPESFLEVLQP